MARQGAAQITNRSKVFVSLLFCSTMLAGVAKAQEQSLAAAPPALLPIDVHGVNVVTGAYSTSEPLITVGVPGGGGLVASRQFIGNGWRESYIGAINTYDNINYTVSVGGGTEIFSKSGMTFTNSEGANSTLTYNNSNLQYTYTLGDGTVLVFGLPAGTGSQGPWAGNQGRLFSVKHPDGQLDTYAYVGLQFCSGGPQVVSGSTTPDGSDASAGAAAAAQPNGSGSCTNVVRLNTITSNTGYRISLQYTDLGTQYNTNHFTVNELDGSNLVVAGGSSTFIAGAGTTTTTTTDGLVSHTFTYTSAGLMLTNQLGISPATTTLTLTYDTSNRVSTLNNGYYTYQYTYSDSGSTRTTTVTGPTGTKVYVANTTTSLVSSYKDELSRTTTFGYDSSGRIQQVTRPEGDYVYNVYDGRGNLTSATIVAKAGSGVANIFTQASYDSSCSVAVKCNKPNYTLDERGFETDYVYDPTHGGVTSVTLPAPSTGAVRPQTRYTYTAYSAPYGSGSIYRLTSTSSCATTSSCSGTSDETKTSLAYGSNLLPSSATAAAGNGAVTATNALTWDSTGNLLTVDGPLAGTADTTRIRYGAGHQILGIVGPDPDGAGPLAYRATRYTYDARGLVTLTEQGTVASQSDSDWSNFSSLIQLSSTYDGSGRKITDAVLQGGTTQILSQYSYNTYALLQCTALRDPAYASSLPSSACSTTASTAPGADQISQINYDAAGEVASVVEGVGTSDQATTAAYTYGGDGEQATAQDANGNLTTFIYDGVNRLKTIEFPDPVNVGSSQTGTNGIETYTYDAASNRTSTVRRGGQTVTYGIDNLNRITGSTQASNSGYANYSFGYDNFSRLTATSSSQGYSHSFTYDALSHKTGEISPFGTIASAYDAAGRRTKLTWSDGFYVAYAYDSVGEMTAVEENGATSGPGVLASIVYDNLGRRTSLTHGNGVVTSYGYDTASRLSSLTHTLPNSAQTQTETYGYSVASQIITKTGSNNGWAWNGAYNFNRTYGVNGLNQQTSSGANTLTSSAPGDLTGDGSLTYGYDANNALITVSNGSTQSYDAVGRLYSVGSGGATRFAYDGDLAIAEYNTSGAILRRFVPGANEDEPLVWYEGSGTTTRYGLTADHLGSITAATTDAGSAAAINSYDEYGLPGTGNAGRYQFTGQKYLSEYGMYDYKARIYSPTLGRFVQPDPIGYGVGLNIYSYTRLDPVNNFDPTGKYPCPTPDNPGLECIDVTANRQDNSLQYYSLAGGGIDLNALLGLFGVAQVGLQGSYSSQDKQPNCNTVLPNGQTIRERVQASIVTSESLGQANPAMELGAQIGQAIPYGPLDPKNNFRNQAPATQLADQGNFMVGSYMTYVWGAAVSRFAAIAYASTMNFLHLKQDRFMDPNGSGMDKSAAVNIPRGNATPGCPVPR